MTAVSLTRPQFSFLKMPQKFRAYVGGFGSGKTYVGCCSLIEHHNNYPGVNSGYFGPSYRIISDVFYPTIEEVAFAHGWRARVFPSNKEVQYYLGKIFKGVTKCRSMDNPGSIIGFKIGKALVDELDTLATDKAKNSWNKIIARMRYKIDGLVNGIDVTTTPEGFKFVYDRFVRNKTASYGLIQAPTYENAINLNSDYIDSLLDSYPAELVKAYVEGHFVNLTAGTVYHSFDRFLNDAPGIFPREKEPLFIGMDFNVGEMSAIVHVVRPHYSRIKGRELVRTPFAVGELTQIFDTPAMIQQIRESYPEHHITVYPDASGDSRDTTNASVTDIKLLKNAGFKVNAKKRNPFVKDRVNSMNAAFCNAQGERLYKVNVNACPTYVECLEQQAYDKNGKPDKKQGLDHAPDGGGYFIDKDFGIKKPSTTSMEI